MTKVKICGLKTEKHVQCAIENGADFVGFVFAASKRQITLNEAKQLCKNIPHSVKKVGVFKDASREEILMVATELQLDFIQYHGNETPEFIRSIPFPSIKAFSVSKHFTMANVSKFDCDYYLFDAPVAGSGKTFDWSMLDDVQSIKDKFILAGGLNANNVEDAIRTFSPIMVDVSSGVETDGVKDCEKIKEFIERAKGQHAYD